MARNKTIIRQSIINEKIDIDDINFASYAVNIRSELHKLLKELDAAYLIHPDETVVARWQNFQLKMNKLYPLPLLEHEPLPVVCTECGEIKKEA